MCLSIMLALGAGIALIALTLMPAGVSLPIYLTFGIFVGPPIFYANMVIACLVGRALFKCADINYFLVVSYHGCSTLLPRAAKT